MQKEEQQWPFRVTLSSSHHHADNGGSANLCHATASACTNQETNHFARDIPFIIIIIIINI